MALGYNRLAGLNLDRLAALSSIFAFAMTLLVLDLRPALMALLPRLLVYAMSFLTLGIFWNGQQVQSIIWPVAVAISPGYRSLFSPLYR